MKTRDFFNKLYNTHTSADPQRHAFHIEDQFAGITLDDKNILEVGCGKGFTSLYLALLNTNTSVTALDQAAGNGSEEGVLNSIKEIVSAHQLEHCLSVEETDVYDFHNYDSYDLIIANNCLHHFCENGQNYFSENAVKNCYIDLFSHLYKLLKNEGLICVSECPSKNRGF